MVRTISDERANPNHEALPNEAMLSPELRVISKLGKGGHGAVYEVADQNCKLYALKVQNISRTGLQLKKEFDIYAKLLENTKSGRRTFGIPSVYGYREYEGVEYMTMERLGDSLDQIAKRSKDNKLPIADVLMVGIQAVKILRDLHDNGILHRDVKPANLAMGIDMNTERTVHIIYFGLARQVDDWKTYNYEEEIGFAGTEYFASAEAFLNKAPTRKGDLECLAYSLLSLARGELPWNYINPVNGRRFRDSEMGMQRLLFKPFLCHGFPELEGFFDAVSNTNRTEKPDYENLIVLLEQSLGAIKAANNEEPKSFESTNDVEPSSTIRSENKRHAFAVPHKALRTDVNSSMDSCPLVPPGFGFKIVQKKVGSVIRVQVVPQHTYHAKKADKSAEKTFALNERPEISSVLHETTKVCSDLCVGQGNGRNNTGPCFGSDCNNVKRLDENNTTRGTEGFCIQNKGRNKTRKRTPGHQSVRMRRNTTSEIGNEEIQNRKRYFSAKAVESSGKTQACLGETNSL